MVEHQRSVCWGLGFVSGLGRLQFFSASAKASLPISLSPFPVAFPVAFFFLLVTAIRKLTTNHDSVSVTVEPCRQLSLTPVTPMIARTAERSSDGVDIPAGFDGKTKAGTLH